MDIALFALGIGLPIAKFVLFPAKTMGRGGNWTIVGALMIVCLMMALWFGIQSLTGTDGDGVQSASSDVSADAAIANAAKQIAALEKLQ